MPGVSAPVRPIVIDMREVKPAATGVGRSVLQLIRATVDLSHQQSFVLLTHAPDSLHAFAQFPNVRVLQVPYAVQQHPAADFWLNVHLPRLLRRLNARLYHGPAFLIPQRRISTPTILTIHDLSMFEPRRYYPPQFRYYMRGIIRRGVSVGSRFVVVSQAVREELIRRFGAEPERVAVVHNAIEPHEQPEADATAIRRLMRLPETYLISVGTLEPRKNPLVLAEALRLMPKWNRPLLVWVGGSGYRSASLHKAMIKMLGPSNLRWIHSIGDGDLRALVRAATLAVYPSLSEGFGIPLLEAMTEGTPILCSDIPAHREVASGAAAYASPEDPRDMASRIEELLKDTPKREALADAGNERVRDFSWRQSALRLLEVYDACGG